MRREARQGKKIERVMESLPSLHNKRILPRHRLLRHYRLPPRRKPPPARPKRPVQYPSILDLGQINDAVGLDFYIVGLDGREQNIGGFFGKGFGREAVEGARPVYLAGAFVEEDGLVGEPVCEVWEGGCGFRRGLALGLTFSDFC